MIRIEVFGTPAPGGSKKVIPVRNRPGRFNVVDDAGPRNKSWRQDVANAAMLAMSETGAKQFAPGTPLILHIDFHMPRPKAHYRKNGELKPGAPKWHTSKPDGLKLRRSTEDALTGVAWHDDSNVVNGSERKIYATYPGAIITIQECKE